MTVRSTRLIAYAWTASATPLLYTCPAGWRTIVKSIQLANNGAAAVSAWLQIFNVPQTVGVIVFQQSVPAGQGVSWNGWQVLNPGETIWGYSSAGSVAIWSSGTVLQLTGQEPV